ncbi:MAG: hypothetical protein A3G41_07715 [Elusimicrobia bacterium RIFCSPLOWO2_12_FULL_59_9]|nr:MAG: hypothetical protein A3G41_07715 [Elusimicrobia bacterium RIFCSPLOWO2_12_FULL_59_9]
MAEVKMPNVKKKSSAGKYLWFFIFAFLGIGGWLSVSRMNESARHMTMGLQGGERSSAPGEYIEQEGLVPSNPEERAPGAPPGSKESGETRGLGVVMVGDDGEGDGGEGGDGSGSGGSASKSGSASTGGPIDQAGEAGGSSGGGKTLSLTSSLGSGGGGGTSASKSFSGRGGSGGMGAGERGGLGGKSVCSGPGDINCLKDTGVDGKGMRALKGIGKDSQVAMKLSDSERARNSAAKRFDAANQNLKSVGSPSLGGGGAGVGSNDKTPGLLNDGSSANSSVSEKKIKPPPKVQAQDKKEQGIWEKIIDALITNGIGGLMGSLFSSASGSKGAQESKDDPTNKNKAKTEEPPKKK